MLQDVIYSERICGYDVSILLYSVEKEYVRNGLWLYWIVLGSQAREESMQGSLLEE